jgi:hypothetical protein
MRCGPETIRCSTRRLIIRRPLLFLGRNFFCWNTFYEVVIYGQSRRMCMRRNRVWWRVGSVALGFSLLGQANFAQEKSMPDAQIEANVLKALAGVPELADQAIGTTTIYGTVTLTGTVRDEGSRDKAEQAVANAAGVKKVIDELTVGVPAPETTGVSQPPEEPMEGAAQGANPNGTMAPRPAPEQPYPSGRQAPIEWPQTTPPPVSTQPGAAYPPQAGYPPQYSRQPYRVQQAGQPVVVPAGTVLRVRINQAMDSRHTQPGTSFDGVVISDVVIGGSVAIPRGAAILGRVSDTQPGGDFRGRGGLALELTQITLEGHPYSLATEAWSHQGYDKTGQTVGNTVGLGAVGATIGAIAGGGPGALLGAGLGAVSGLGVSSASHSGEATVPSEAIVNFRLSQQAALMTVSQAELDRLGAGFPPPPGTQQPLRRRTYYPPPPPPPPPYYYGPVYYPYPYYYPYYR